LHSSPLIYYCKIAVSKRVSKSMKPKLQEAFKVEMTVVAKAYTSGDLDVAFHHLERAHIMGQRYFYPHITTHWWMLKIGLLRSDIREIFGQLLRLFAVFPASIFGWVPTGNTGGANVSALKPMPIPEDIALLFVDYKTQE